MIIYNRDDFIAWTEGILLQRDSSGRVIVGDAISDDVVQKAMDSGEKIFLCEGAVGTSRIISYIQKYQECPYEEMENRIND